MENNNRKAFTLVEILVASLILFAIIGVAITMMSRGASNVQKGSFNALAANQASWIVSSIRDDMARSNARDIEFPCAVDEPWTGQGSFRVKVEGGRATYFLEKKGKKKVFVRKFKKEAGSSAFVLQDDQQQSFGDEYLTTMSVTKKEDGSYFIEIEMDENTKSKGGSDNKPDFTWNSSIYPPNAEGLDKYWKPTVEVSNE